MNEEKRTLALPKRTRPMSTSDGASKVPPLILDLSRETPERKREEYLSLHMKALEDLSAELPRFDKVLDLISTEAFREELLTRIRSDLSRVQKVIERILQK
jgi:hypothetical protein